MSAQEDECEAHTDQQLRVAGKKAPETLRQTGTVLSLLDRAASCYWGCAGGDHAVEYLAGRATSGGRAALRLMRFGFYDEALANVRGVGEVANLLFLFAFEPDALEEWRATSAKERRRNFQPLRVRQRLEQIGEQPPISQERYSLLSERLHSSPEPPRAHNPFRVPVLAAVYQPMGALLVLNELAAAVALAASGTALVQEGRLDDDRRGALAQAASDLGERLGGVSITEVEALHEELERNPDVRDAIQQLRRSRAQRERRR